MDIQSFGHTKKFLKIEFSISAIKLIFYRVMLILLNVEAAYILTLSLTIVIGHGQQTAMEDLFAIFRHITKPEEIFRRSNFH